MFCSDPFDPAVIESVKRQKKGIAPKTLKLFQIALLQSFLLILSDKLNLKTHLKDDEKFINSDFYLTINSGKGTHLCTTTKNIYKM